MQLTILGPTETSVSVRGIVHAPASSTFHFFNVAVSSPEEAIEAARKKANAPSDAPMRVVRQLSLPEIAALGLRDGQVKPA